MISLLCPSRQRATKASQMIESVRSTISNIENVEILLAIDPDEPELEEYLNIMPSLHLIDATTNGQRLNALASFSSGDFLYYINDDVLFRTPNWDTLLVEAFTEKYPDNIGVIYANNGHYLPLACSFPMVHRRWREILGHITLDVFEHFFNAAYISTIARDLGRLHYMPDVLIEHMHWLVTGDKDITAQHVIANGRLSKDRQAFICSEEQRQEGKDKLLKYMINS